MKGCHARLLDSADMNKNVRRSIVGGDEAKALLGVEKLHCTNRHYIPSRANSQPLRTESVHCLLQPYTSGAALTRMRSDACGHPLWPGATRSAQRAEYR